MGVATREDRFTPCSRSPKPAADAPKKKRSQQASEPWDVTTSKRHNRIANVTAADIEPSKKTSGAMTTSHRPRVAVPAEG
jgi:hypothetical protein